MRGRRAQRAARFGLLASLILAACSATGRVEETVPIAAPLGAYETARLDVTTDGFEDAEIVRLVEAKLDARLTREGVFARVTSAAVDVGAPDLDLRVRILHLSRVSTTGRALVGGLAGRGGIRMEVELVDLATGTSLGTVTAEGKSSGGTAFSGRTGQAIDQAVERIVATLAAHR